MSDDELIEIRIVPIEVFGTGDCCEHSPDGVAYDERGCRSTGYGLMDAVQAWSDCNRAAGHTFRFDDTEPEYRLPGETLTVWVKRPEYETFAARQFGGSESDIVHMSQMARLQAVGDFLGDLIDRASERGEAGGDFEQRGAEVVKRCRVTVELIDP